MTGGAVLLVVVDVMLVVPQCFYILGKYFGKFWSAVCLVCIFVVVNSDEVNTSWTRLLA